jgi:hypothetical protein
MRPPPLPLIFIKATVPTSERVSTEFVRPVVTTLMFFTFFPQILAINAKFAVFQKANNI